MSRHVEPPNPRGDGATCAFYTAAQISENLKPLCTCGHPRGHHKKVTGVHRGMCRFCGNFCPAFTFEDPTIFDQQAQANREGT